MDALAWLLLIYYVLAIVVICVYGLHRYWLVWAFLRSQRRAVTPTPRPFATLPRVTVQLPMFNERRVAERIIRAACALDYPSERLQVQVLDDSTDDSAAMARRCCEALAAAGHDIRYLHRARRDGFKAGALEAGLRLATGEFIAVFDADFVPPPDLLRRTIHHFTDERTGMVQARWAHLNRDESWLTEIQAMSLDGHFVIEQAARCATGRWFNFNGTAGIWRRRCIEEAGGWQHDTLTEDTDLSYRAQLEGWRFVFLPDVTCPAEIPPTIEAFLGQQHRWNKGLVQTGMKLLPRILTGPYSLRRKIEAWFHLTCPLVHVAILLLVLLVAPALAVMLPLYAVDPLVGAVIGLLILLLGTFAAATFYVASQRVQGYGLWRTVLRLPALMAVGIGVSVVNTRAVLEAVLGRSSPFIRTPKYDGQRTGDLDPAAGRRRLIPTGAIELGLGLLMIACLAFTWVRPHALVGAPFLVLFAAGFLLVGGPCLARSLGRLREQPGIAATSIKPSG